MLAKHYIMCQHLLTQHAIQKRTQCAYNALKHCSYTLAHATKNNAIAAHYTAHAHAYNTTRNALASTTATKIIAKSACITQLTMYNVTHAATQHSKQSSKQSACKMFNLLYNTQHALQTCSVKLKLNIKRKNMQTTQNTAKKVTKASIVRTLIANAKAQHANLTVQQQKAIVVQQIIAQNLLSKQLANVYTNNNWDKAVA